MDVYKQFFRDAREFRGLRNLASGVNSSLLDSLYPNWIFRLVKPCNPVSHVGLAFLVYVIAFSSWERLEPEKELTKEEWLVRAKENNKRPIS